MAYPSGISDRAKAARIRNWKLLQLRGLYYKTHLLLKDDCADIELMWRRMVDRAIEALGAESQTAKEKRERQEFDGALEKENV